MRVKTQDYNNVSVVELEGDLDNDSIELLQRTINDIIATQKTGIVLDMRRLVSVDSAGLERLLWARDYCDENDCQLRLAGLDENCAKILELTRLESEFGCYSELAEAVKSFA